MKAQETTPFNPGAMSITEQAIQLLRQKGSAALTDYYIGSLPFVLALLYFWSDMSRNAHAAGYCAPAAAGLALLFIWMKYWQVRFCRRLWNALNDDICETWPWRRSCITAARQALLHATGLVLLALAAVVMFPLAWVYAFYQNVCILDEPETRGLRMLYKHAAHQAALWPGQNHVLLTLISAFTLFVFANLAVGLMVMPYLLKWLLGIETRFTISGLYAMTNTTFLAIAAALTYLCVDPILKSVYTLRCFHGRSRRTGEDLRAALKPFLITGLLLMASCLAPGRTAAATWPHAVEGDNAAMAAALDDPVYVDRLDESITRVLQQRRFAWRLPREQAQAPSDESGWLTRAVKLMTEQIQSIFESIDDWLESLSEWLRKHLGDEDPRGSGTDWRAIVRLVFWALGILLALLLLVYIRRWLMKRPADRRKKPLKQDEPRVDIHDESITADLLPRDQWLRLAGEMTNQKNFRLALRAFYLAVLSQLGDHHRIVIARYKSNREYLAELARRDHAEPELVERFDRCMTAFEKAWYGMHQVGEHQLSEFMADQERIADLVQHAA